MFSFLALIQPELAQQFSRLVEQQAVPQALLFAGPAYSGRMSAALDLAKELSGPELASRFRYLEQDNVVIVSNREHRERITALAQMYSTGGNDAVRSSLIRAVRILLLQFHPALTEEQQSKTKTALNVASTVQEALYAIEHATEEDDRKNLVQNLLTSLNAFFTAKRQSAVAVSQIRSIKTWASHTALDGVPRFVILEQLEIASESVKNSMLKLLEEPPQDTWIIVISENPARLLSTIRSRLRPFYFSEPDVQTVKRVIQEGLIMRPERTYQSLRQFFLHQSGLDTGEIEQVATWIMETAAADNDIDQKRFQEILLWIDDASRFEHVMITATSVLEKKTRTQEFSEYDAKRLLDCINRTWTQVSVYNQSRKSALEAMVYRMRNKG